MTPIRFVVVLLALLTLPGFAQQNPALGFDQSANSNVVQIPAQLRRVPPPAKTASKDELEQEADLLRAQKNFADSIDYYQAAIKLGDSAALENKVGIVELQLTRLKEAIKRFEKSAKLNREYAEAYNNLGAAYYLKRNYGKSIKAYTEAIKNQPEAARFHSNLGTTYFAKKDYDKASYEYMQALQIDPDVFNQHSPYAVTLSTDSPGDRAKFHFTIAKVFAKQGDTDRCLLYLTKAIEEGFPTISDVYKEAEFSGVIKDPRFVSLMASKPEAVK